MVEHLPGSARVPYPLTIDAIRDGCQIAWYPSPTHAGLTCRAWVFAGPESPRYMVLAESHSRLAGPSEAERAILEYSARTVVARRVVAWATEDPTLQWRPAQEGECDAP